MKPKTLIPLVIGLGVGFFAIKMGIDMVQRAKGAQGGEKAVLLSAKKIEAACRITDAMLTASAVPASLIPPQAFTEKKALLGRVSCMTIAPGVPITAAMLAPPGAKPGLPSMIPAGFRAVAVSVTEESAVGGFIVPGSRVDVSSADEKTHSSKLILTNIEVGAVGQSLAETLPEGKGTKVSKSVTLFLKPDEVQVLHAYSGKGRIRLALRGTDADPKDSFWSLLAGNIGPKEPRSPHSPKPAAAPQQVVEVLRGSQAEQIVFDGAAGGSRRSMSKSDHAGFGGRASPTPHARTSEPAPEIRE